MYNKAIAVSSMTVNVQVPIYTPWGGKRKDLSIFFSSPWPNAWISMVEIRTHNICNSLQHHTDYQMCQYNSKTIFTQFVAHILTKSSILTLAAGDILVRCFFICFWNWVQSPCQTYFNLLSHLFCVEWRNDMFECDTILLCWKRIFCVW